jgi:hypothetical protein
MAVPRVEWQCPGCERRFAIRADIQTPDLCPQCRTEAASPVKSRAADEASVPDTQSVRDAREETTPPPVFMPEESAVEELPTPQIETSGPLRKYPALKFLSLVYKVFAALIALGGLVTLVIAVIGAFTVEDPAARIAGILLQLGGFVGSVFVAVTLYAFGELIQLLIDIESNTRATRGSRA